MIPTALGPLHVRRHGAGGPTVLLWHSLFLDGTSWDPVLPALSPGRSLLVVDGPCHGQSPGPGRRFTLEECADAALTLLDHAGIAQVDWVGNAWGGHVGVVLAARAPERVRRLAVVCSPMHALRPLERLRARVLAGLLGLAGWRGFLLKAVRGALLRAPMRPEVVAAVDGAAQAPGAARTLLAIRSVMLGRPHPAAGEPDRPGWHPHALPRRLGAMPVPSMLGG